MNNNQRFAAEIGLLLVLGAAVFVKAAPQAYNETIRAKRFEVVGKDGKARIELEVDKNDMPHVRLLDPQGNERAVLELSHGGSPVLSLSDVAGGANVRLDVDERAAGLTIYGLHSDTPEGTANRSIGLHIYKSQQAGLDISDSLVSPSGHVENFGPRVQAGVAEDGSTFLILSGKKQPGRISAHVSLNGQVGVDIYDKSNKRIWTVPIKTK